VLTYFYAWVGFILPVNKLLISKHAQILGLVTEGNSLRATSGLAIFIGVRPFIEVVTGTRSAHQKSNP